MRRHRPSVRWWAPRCLLLCTLAASAACGGENPTLQQSASPTRHTACPASAGRTGTVNDHGAAAATGPSLSLEVADFYFSPTCVTGVPAGTVTLSVRNAGQNVHNLSVPGQGIDQDVAKGATISVQVKVGTASIPFFCKYHRTSGMQGSLVPS